MKKYLFFAACCWVACLSGVCLVLYLPLNSTVKVFGTMLCLFCGMAGDIYQDFYYRMTNVIDSYRSLLNLKNYIIRFLCGLRPEELETLSHALTAEELAYGMKRIGDNLAELKERRKGRLCREIDQLENILHVFAKAADKK